MALINFVGFETGQTGENQSAGGTYTFSSATVRSGGYSWRSNPTGTAVSNYRIAAIRADGRPIASFNKASCYVTAWIYIASAPASAEEKIIEFADTGGSTKGYFTITSGRILKYYNNAGTLIETGTNAVPSGQWVELSFRGSTGSGSQPYEAKINGVTELTGTAAQLTNNHGTIYIGKRTNLNGASFDIYWDDVVIDDAAYVTGVEIVRLGPTANGTPAQWTSGTGASDYTQVDEVPRDTADYIQAPASTNRQHYVVLADSSTQGIAGTILAVKAHGMLREVTTGSSSSTLDIRVGSSTVSTSAYNHTTTNQDINLIALVDPDTGLAWTTGGLDAMEIGVNQINAVALRCFYLSAYILFQPPVSSAPIEYIGFM